MIIGIAGRKYSGKDVVADMIIERKGKGVKMHFAQPLKAAVKELFLFSDNQLNVTKEEIDPFWNVSPRQTLQYIGTEWVRDNIDQLIPGMGADFFLKCMQRRIGQCGDDIICIPDVRFDNEAQFIRQNGGIIIKMIRDIQHNEYSNHRSEQQIDHIAADIVIENNGTLEQLRGNVISIIDSELK